ncbi:MAG: PP0621 family protein [Burkholderiales bacterium]
MSKLLLLIVAVVVIYILIKGAARNRDTGADSAGTAAAESMVPCAQCGVNLPRSEALEAQGRFYCSEEHRRLASG